MANLAKFKRCQYIITVVRSYYHKVKSEILYITSGRFRIEKETRENEATSRTYKGDIKLYAVMLRSFCRSLICVG